MSRLDTVRRWTWLGILGTLVAVGVLLLTTVLPTAAPSLARPSALFASTAASAHCSVGSHPEFPAYDPVNHEIYVPNGLSSNITVLNATCARVATVTLPKGSSPTQAAFDPVNNRVYVTDYALNQVYEISGTKLVSTITGLSQPSGIIFNPIFGDMVVANYGANDVAFLNTAVAGVSFTQMVGVEPWAIAYDPSPGILLVTNFGSNNVSVVPANGAGPITSIPVGDHPQGIAYDIADAAAYVANYGSNNVSVIGTSGPPVATLTGFDEPSSVVWSQSALGIYITNVGSGKVDVLAGTNGPSGAASVVKTYTTASTAGAFGLAYDEATDDMFVTAVSNDRVYIVG